MHKALRGVIVGSLMCLAVPVLPQSALAAEASEAPSTGAYFWRGKLPSTISIGGQTQPNPINGQDTDLDGVARDQLAVAVTAPGQSDKESFLLWDLFDLTENDTITKFVVTSPLSDTAPSDDPAQNTVQSGGATAALQACSPTGGFGPTDAGAYELKPEVDLEACVPGTFDEAAGAYTFDVTPLTKTWLTAENYGIAIVPADLTQPFQVVFKPADAHLAAITYTAGEAVDEMPLDLDTDLGGTGTTTTTFDSGFSSGGGESVLGSAPMTSFDAPLAAEAPLPATEEPVAAEEPVTAPVQAASVARTVPSGPPLGFWLLAAVLGMALFAMSLATGAPVAATAGSSAPRREGRVLKHVQQMSLARGTA